MATIVPSLQPQVSAATPVRSQRSQIGSVSIVSPGARQSLLAGLSDGASVFDKMQKQKLAADASKRENEAIEKIARAKNEAKQKDPDNASDEFAKSTKTLAAEITRGAHPDVAHKVQQFIGRQLALGNAALQGFEVQRHEDTLVANTKQKLFDLAQQRGNASNPKLRAAIDEQAEEAVQMFETSSVAGTAAQQAVAFRQAYTQDASKAEFATTLLEAGENIKALQQVQAMAEDPKQFSGLSAGDRTTAKKQVAAAIRTARANAASQWRLQEAQLTANRREVQRSTFKQFGALAMQGRLLTGDIMKAQFDGRLSNEMASVLQAATDGSSALPSISSPTAFLAAMETATDPEATVNQKLQKLRRVMPGLSKADLGKVMGKITELASGEGRLQTDTAKRVKDRMLGVIFGVNPLVRITDLDKIQRLNVTEAEYEAMILRGSSPIEAAMTLSRRAVEASKLVADNDTRLSAFRTAKIKVPRDANGLIDFARARAAIRRSDMNARLRSSALENLQRLEEDSNKVNPIEQFIRALELQQGKTQMRSR